MYVYVELSVRKYTNIRERYDRIADAILSLEKMPERIKIMDSEPEHSISLRSYVDNYTIFYKVKGNTVSIARVLYSASDIGKRLFEEL